MTYEEKKNLLVKMGLREETAENYLGLESDIWAVLPAFRLLKPLSDNLDFYKGGYRKMIEKMKEDGALAEKMPEINEMLNAGVSPETIEKFVYDIKLSTYDSLLYQLDDYKGAEVSDVFGDASFSKCGYGRLMEQRPDGELTGRYLIEVHGKIPFSDLY